MASQSGPITRVSHATRLHFPAEVHALLLVHTHMPRRLPRSRLLCLTRPQLQDTAEGKHKQRLIPGG